MPQDLFDTENLFFRTLSRGVDIVGLSILWAVLCLPVITIGPATAALYYTVVKVFREKEEGAFGLFLKAFKDNFKSGILLTLIVVPLMILLVWGYDVMSNNISSSQGIVMYMAYYVMLLLPIGTICYLFPLMGRYEFKISQLMITAFSLAMKHLPSTLIIVLLTIELAVFVIEQWWPVLFVPVAGMILCSLFLERIFGKYT